MQVLVTGGTGVVGRSTVSALLERGHDVRLFSLGGQPDWFELDVQVETFEDYEALAAALADEDAIKVATWWNTAAAVWRASLFS